MGGDVLHRLRFRWTDETAAKQTDYDKLMRQTPLLGMMDDNIDGKLQTGELRGDLAAFADKLPLADANKDGGLDNTEFQAALAAIKKMRESKPWRAPGSRARDQSKKREPCGLPFPCDLAIVAALPEVR